MTNREKVSIFLKQFADDYVKSGKARRYSELADNLCEDFACDFVDHIKRVDLEIDAAALSIENFLMGIDGCEYGDDIFDVDLLNRFWPNVIPPKNITWENLNQLHFPYHVWVYADGFHFDALCLEGVSNFLDLPVFKSFIEDYIV